MSDPAEASGAARAKDRSMCSSGAPYGYRYVRKSDDAAARYEINHAEADCVRTVYDQYVGVGMSIGAITRLLNERGVPTRKQISRWERSTV